MMPPTIQPGTHARDEKIGRVVIPIFKMYWYFFTVLVGAGLAAFVAHYIIDVLVLQFGTKDWPPHRAQHFGWVLGAVLCAIGTPLGWCRVYFGECRQEGSHTAEEAKLPPEVENVPCPPDSSLGNAVRVGLIGGLVGILLGILLGATLMLMWVSITMSPWGPSEWVEALHLNPAGFSTSHPIAGGLWLGSMAVMGVLGFLLGLVGAPLGWATATWGTPASQTPHVPGATTPRLGRVSLPVRILLLLLVGTFIASLATHLATFFGFSPRPVGRSVPLKDVHPVWMLHAFAVLLTGAAFLMLMRTKAGFENLRAIPGRVWWLWLLLAAYAVITFIAQIHFATGGRSGVRVLLPDHITARIFSGLWMLFTGLGALLCYASSTTSDDTHKD